MKLISGDETGLLKFVDLSTRNYLTHFPSIGKQSRLWSIKSMCWLIPNDEFALLRSNGRVEYWTCDQSGLNFVTEFDCAMSNPVRVLSVSGNRKVEICCDDSGRINLLSKTNNGVSQISEFHLSGPIDACAARQSFMAFGGKENDLKLYDVNTEATIWSAKNVPYDNLSLRVPIWVTAIAFLNEQSMDVTQSGTNILTGTAHRQIRLYDTRHQRQPEASFEIGEFRVTSILPGVVTNTVYAGDVSGCVHLWDFRMQRRVSTLRGGVGSVRDLQTNSSRNAIAAVGLERFAKIYDNSTTSSVASTSQGHLLASAYLKNRLNCCLLLDGSLSGLKGSQDNLQDEIEDEDDEYQIQNFVDSDDDDDDGIEAGVGGNADEVEVGDVSPQSELDEDSLREKRPRKTQPKLGKRKKDKK